jgi:hypothetical protein
MQPKGFQEKKIKGRHASNGKSNVLKLLALTNLFSKIRIADPHHFNAGPDPDQTFFLLNADPALDPYPLQS